MIILIKSFFSNEAIRLLSYIYKEKSLFTFPALENGIREKKIRELHILYEKKWLIVFLWEFFISRQPFDKIKVKMEYDVTYFTDKL